MNISRQFNQIIFFTQLYNFGKWLIQILSSTSCKEVAKIVKEATNIVVFFASDK